MSIATVTSKGQITIPQDVREELGIVTGTKVEFVRYATGHIAFVARTRSITELAGILKSDGPPLTIEQMDEAIGDYMAEQDRLSRS
jgi:AbrB family looped-hinge helix DNA binding protein